MSEKIQKVLANAGIGSRREIETWIDGGRVTLNGKTAKLGERMTYFDQVCVDGREIKLVKSKNQQARVLLYHKPEGEMCTRDDPEGRPTVFARMPLIRNSRWICVGRLDFNTSGLLLITNNGALAHKLMHPSSEIEREYAVRIRSELTPAQITRLQEGIHLEDGLAHFHQITDAGGRGSNHWYHVTVKEGHNRLVRRLFEALDLTVSRLIRIRFGTISLPQGLRRCHHIELSPQEVTKLTRSLGERSETRDP